MDRKMVKFESNYWKLENPQDSVEGTYMGNTHQEKEFDGRKYIAYEYTIQTEDKKLVKINGNKMINDFFMHLPVGTWIQLVYLGERANQAGNIYKTFDMFHEELKDGYKEVTQIEEPKKKETKEEEMDVPF